MHALEIVFGRLVFREFNAVKAALFQQHSSRSVLTYEPDQNHCGRQESCCHPDVIQSVPVCLVPAPVGAVFRKTSPHGGKVPVQWGVTGGRDYKNAPR